MKLVPLLLLGLVFCCNICVQALDFQDKDDDFITSLMKKDPSRKKPKKSPPSAIKKAPAPPVIGRPSPAPQMMTGGLAAPLYRRNMRGFSVPLFVVELGVGNPPVRMNFTIDTMGRETALPWATCSNATREKSSVQFRYNKADKEKTSPPPAKTSPSSPPPKSSAPTTPPSPPPYSSPPTTPPSPSPKSSPPTTPPSPPKSSTPPTPPSPPPKSSLPPTSPPSPPPSMTTTVPCTHEACKGSKYQCDLQRMRCMGFDRFTGRPVDLVQTQVTLQSSGVAPAENRSMKGVIMSCSDQSAAPYTSTNLVSLAPGPHSLFSQLTKLSGLPRKFAYCLGKPHGALFIGGADYIFRQHDVKLKMEYLPMITSSSWERGLGYRLALKAMAVGSMILPIDPSMFDKGVIIGTKARYTSLVDPAYQVVRRHFSKVAASYNSSITPVPSPFPELNLCYRIPARAAVGGAPKIQFIFQNATLTVEPRNYIVRWRKSDTVCLGIVSAGPLGKVSVIGTLQQEETMVEFDLEKNVVGVSEPLILTGNSCRNFEFLRLPAVSAQTGIPPSPAAMPNAADEELAEMASFDEDEDEDEAESPVSV